MRVELAIGVGALLVSRWRCGRDDAGERDDAGRVAPAAVIFTPYCFVQVRR